MLRERLRLSIGCLSVQFIRQWGIQTVLSNGQQFSMPISMDNCWAIIISDVDIGCDRFGASKSGNSSFLVWSKNNQNNFVKTEFQYVLIGSNN